MLCKLNNLTVHYVEHGAGVPVVLLHGFTPDHRLMTGAFEPVFAERDGYRRLYPDLPGMGQTPGADWIAGSDQMLQVVQDFIDALLPGQDFLLAGQSYGAYLAQGLAQAWPQRVRGLMLLCPVTEPNVPARELPPHQILQRDATAMQNADMSPQQRQEFDAIAVVQTERTWSRTRDEIVPGLRLGDQNFLQALRKRGMALGQHPVPPQQHFDKPTLIFCGRQDAIVGYSDAWRLMQYYPHASYAALDQSGHHAHLEAPAIFNAMVSEWLQRCEQRQPGS